jgi:hypothetical protein
MRAESGDRREAERLYREAAQHGDTTALAALTQFAEQDGDRNGAFLLAIEAANQGDSMAMLFLAEMRFDAGETATAEKLMKFGLTDSGKPADSLSFTPPGNPDTGGAHRLSWQEPDNESA